MSLVDKTVKVETSIEAFGNVAVNVAADFKAKKPLLAILGNLGSGILGALGQIGELKPDLSDRAHLFTTVGLKVGDTLNALFPQN